MVHLFIQYEMKRSVRELKKTIGADRETQLQGRPKSQMIGDYTTYERRAKTHERFYMIEVPDFKKGEFLGPFFF